MKKRDIKTLTLHRETLHRLSTETLAGAAGAGTLTYEGSCDNSLCPCPSVDGCGGLF